MTDEPDAPGCVLCDGGWYEIRAWESQVVLRRLVRHEPGCPLAGKP